MNYCPFYALRRQSAATLLAAAMVGIALLATITIVGPTTLAATRLPWLAVFLAVLGGASLWWALYLWLLNRLGGWSWREGLDRSLALVAVLSLSPFPSLAVFLSGKLPYTLVFDAELRSLYRWIAGSLVFVAFAGQELVLAGAVQRKGLRELAIGGLRHLSALPGSIGRLPDSIIRHVRRNPLLVAILAVGMVQRWEVVDLFHPGDMNDTLSVVYTLLRWPPFGYYHDYRPQTHVYAHLPVFPMMIAPFYWFFENVAKLPTPWAAKLISALADMAAAVLICSQARARWKGGWGLILAAAWLLSPRVVESDDHAVGTAAAFSIAALASLQRPWQCGILMGLGAATRNEAAFLALPLIVHFTARRELRESVAFLGAFSTTLGVEGMPFLLTDPEAMDYAMRQQPHRQASGQLSILLAFLQPCLPAGLASVLQQNPSLLAIAVTMLSSLLAMRDGRVARVVLVVALAFILALPVLHPRYTILAYAGALFYAARHGNPLVVVAIVAAIWPESWAPAVQAAFAAALAVAGLLQLDRPWRVPSGFPGRWLDRSSAARPRGDRGSGH